MRSDSVWSAASTTPEAIERALRELLVERFRDDPGATPARVLNLIVVVERQWSGEIANRLRRVGDYHGSRTIICQVEPGRTTLDATVSIAGDDQAADARTVELVVLTLGPRHLQSLGTILDPLVATDLLTVAWAPHGHEEALPGLLEVAAVVLVDAVDDPEPGAALAKIGELSERARVVDLAWLRSAPWRERIAALFDGADDLRPQLGQISSVTIRHEAESTAAALLLLGWLGERLGWELGPLERGEAGVRTASASRGEQPVELVLERADLAVRGLSGMTIALSGGLTLALDRGPGGLSAVRTAPDGREHRWTILGASRGEGGILGEGIRQALLRDPLYRPALLGAIELAG